MVFSLKFAINKITIKAKKDLTLTQFTQEDYNFHTIRSSFHNALRFD